jgi:hypothetical protein
MLTLSPLVASANVSAALLIILLLIGASPAILIIDGPVIYAGVATLSAVAVAVVGRQIRPGEAGYLLSLIRSLAIVTAIPALWMVIQILPLKVIGLSHPIWESAEAALGRPIAGSISIDSGATLISLCRYLSTAAIAFVATAVAVDRQRAEWILFALMGATTIIAAMIVAHLLWGGVVIDATTRDQALDSVALGMMVSTAATIRTFERLETSSRSGNSALPKYMPAFVGSFTAFAICLLAVVLDGTRLRLFAVAYGLATSAAVLVIRRFGFGLWGGSAIAAAAIVITILVILGYPGIHAVDLTLAFATRAPASLVAVTQRMLADVTWTGTGAGTFGALLPIYRDVDDGIIGPGAPTAAAATAIELGRPMLWAIVITVVSGIVILLRGALRRGRDSFYPTAGASCLVTLLILSFVDAGLFGTTLSIIAASVLGLALAQNWSRSVR